MLLIGQHEEHSACKSLTSLVPKMVTFGALA